MILLLTISRQMEKMKTLHIKYIKLEQWNELEQLFFSNSRSVGDKDMTSSNSQELINDYSCQWCMGLMRRSVVSRAKLKRVTLLLSLPRKMSCRKLVVTGTKIHHNEPPNNKSLKQCDSGGGRRRWEREIRWIFL